jgi:hypothetical protein
MQQLVVIPMTKEGITDEAVVESNVENMDKVLDVYQGWFTTREVTMKSSLVVNLLCFSDGRRFTKREDFMVTSRDKITRSVESTTPILIT